MVRDCKIIRSFVIDLDLIVSISIEPNMHEHEFLHVRGPLAVLDLNNEINQEVSKGSGSIHVNSVQREEFQYFKGSGVE